MKNKTSLLIITIISFFIILGNVYYFTLKPSIKLEDINIRATLKQLENLEDNYYYSYLIDLIVENKSQHIYFFHIQKRNLIKILAGSK